MHIEIVSQAFEPYARLQDYQANLSTPARQFGATNVFVGTMRDFNQGDQVQSMVLEHYPGMTEKELALIASEAEQKWDVLEDRKSVV